MSANGVSLSLYSVGQGYDSREIFSNLDLNIRAGEFLTLLGPSGCGKSTLLRLLADLQRPTSGRIEIQPPEQTLFRSFVFQEPHLIPWRTVLQNVCLPLELTGRNKFEAEGPAEMVLEKVGLSDSLRLYPNQLSGGMKMRVSVARALVTSPRLLLLDEPYSALDENTRYILQEQLRDLWLSLRMTVVFVTHSISEAVYLSERAILLSRKPARILIDRKIDLPDSRPPEIRTDRRFIDEVKVINESFPRGDS